MSSSIPSDLTAESLTILNIVQLRLKTMLQEHITHLEQKASDARETGHLSLAQILKNEAMVSVILQSKVSSTITQLFLEVLQELNHTSPSHPVVSQVKEVELPELPRRPYSKDGVIEVKASQAV